MSEKQAEIGGFKAGQGTPGSIISHAFRTYPLPIGRPFTTIPKDPMGLDGKLDIRQFPLRGYAWYASQKFYARVEDYLAARQSELSDITRDEVKRVIRRQPTLKRTGVNQEIPMGAYIDWLNKRSADDLSRFLSVIKGLPEHHADAIGGLQQAAIPEIEDRLYKMAEYMFGHEHHLPRFKEYLAMKKESGKSQR